MTYRIKVTLTDVEPVVWRRVEIASDVTLDQVHEILQTAMGWSNYHLHQFISGEDPHGRDVERYLEPMSIDEGMVGIDERQVRLDEVLVEPGDGLWYEYDFGDDWLHRLDLEQVRPRAAGEPPARCLDGANACPPEDCGGPPGYLRLVETLAEPPSPERDDLIDWLGRPFDPAEFDATGTDAALASGRRAGIPALEPGSLLGRLLATMVLGVPHPLHEALVGLNAPAPAVSDQERADAVQEYSRLIDRVGDEGITLTQAGYLPPSVVRELAAELSVDEFWGKHNREVNTIPVLEFRESAQALGLLRKHRGRLLLTRASTIARADPDRLWRHIAAALPLRGRYRGPEADCAFQASTLLLLGVTAGLNRTQRMTLMTTGLSAAGWHGSDGEPVPDHVISRLVSPTSAVLKHLSVLGDGYAWPPTDPPIPPAGVAIARAALGV